MLCDERLGIRIKKRGTLFIQNYLSKNQLKNYLGVAFYTNKSLNKWGNIKNIENGSINYEIFNNLAYGQWTLEEMRNGEAWDFLKQNII